MTGEVTTYSKFCIYFCFDANVHVTNVYAYILYYGF